MADESKFLPSCRSKAKPFIAVLSPLPTVLVPKDSLDPDFENTPCNLLRLALFYVCAAIPSFLEFLELTIMDLGLTIFFFLSIPLLDVVFILIISGLCGVVPL